MDLQEAFEAFLNTNELTSSDQIDLYFDNFVSAFRTWHNKYAPLTVVPERGGQGGSTALCISVQ